MSLFKEFKAFALRGNVIDLAVGIIIGSAFSDIVNSIVKDIMMPIVSLLTGSVDFSQHFIRMGDIPPHFTGNPHTAQDLQSAGVAVLSYGHFLTVVVNFIILAFVIFMMIKGINKLKNAIQSTDRLPSHTDSGDNIVILLREIRDTLQK